MQPRSLYIKERKKERKKERRKVAAAPALIQTLVGYIKCAWRGPQQGDGRFAWMLTSIQRD
jgi:hypothetical protein